MTTNGWRIVAVLLGLSAFAAATAAWWHGYTLDVQRFLALWAVIGPISAAALSAVWQRRIQVNDRAYHANIAAREHAEATQREQLAYQRAREQAAADARRADIESERIALVVAVSKLLTAIDLHTRIASEATTAPITTEKTDRGRQAFSEMASAYNALVLMGDDDFYSLATTAWNCALQLPIPYSAGISDDYQQKLAAYRSAKVALISAAKQIAREHREQANACLVGSHE